MATQGNILGQAKPAGGVDTTLFTVPALSQYQVNLFVCNQAGVAETYRVALVPSGALSDEHYIVYDESLPANFTRQITGICLYVGGKIIVRSASGNISFTATGLILT